MAEDRTVIVEAPRSGGGATWVIALALIVALIVGIVFFTQMSNSETAKNNAITGAAQNVGQAARDVGSTAKDVGDSAK
jgi:uncharacterized protein HemX